MQITMPYSGRLAGKSESSELLRSKDNALMFCNIRPKQPFNKPVHKTFGDEKKNSTCLSFRKHSLSTSQGFSTPLLYTARMAARSVGTITSNSLTNSISFIHTLAASDGTAILPHPSIVIVVRSIDCTL